MNNLKSLVVWQKGIALVEAIYTPTSLMPKVEQYGHSAQIEKTAVSISLNTTERARQSSIKKQSHYPHIAFGSLFELETQLIIIERLKLILNKQIKLDFDSIVQLIKAMYRYIKTINN